MPGHAGRMNGVLTVVRRQRRRALTVTAARRPRHARGGDAVVGSMIGVITSSVVRVFRAGESVTAFAHMFTSSINYLADASRALFRYAI